MRTALGLLGSGELRRRAPVLLAASRAEPSGAPLASTGAAQPLDAFLGTGRRAQPLLQPVPATQGDDLKPGQLRLESDFRPHERDLHHFRLDLEHGSSGSSQFTLAGLKSIQAAVAQARPGARLVVVDLRQESHGLLHGAPVEWMGTHNQANQGKSPQAVAADEGRRLASVGGQSEATLCESAGVEYLRLPVTDHLTPDEATVAQLVALARQLEGQGAWVHFHCKAGRGRTTTFMALWEMLHTDPARLEGKAVLERQRELGGIDILKTKLPMQDGGSSLARRNFALGFAARLQEQARAAA